MQISFCHETSPVGSCFYPPLWGSIKNHCPLVEEDYEAISTPSLEILAPKIETKRGSRPTGKVSEHLKVVYFGD